MDSLRDRFQKALNEIDCEDVAKCINQGIDVNTMFFTGNSPLHIAVGRANLELLDILLDAGADVLLKNERKLTPIEVAADNARRCEAWQPILDRLQEVANKKQVCREFQIK